MDLSAAVWRKSSRSGSNGGQCVEVATNLPGAVAVRDSKDPGGPKLLLTPAGWQSFVGGVKAGDFDRLSRLSQLGKFRPSLNRSTTPSFLSSTPDRTTDRGFCASVTVLTDSGIEVLEFLARAM
ncbi:DUF397 domain-containing protein [Streptosporangium lutulentum]